MLSLYRRHQASCKYREKGSGYNRCKCPVWVDGHLDGKRFRMSLDTRDWVRAEKDLAAIERGEIRSEITLGDAVKEFVEDQAGRKLATATVKHYRNTLSSLVKAIGASTALRDIKASHLSTWRAGLEVSATTSNIRLEHIRALFNFCVARGHLETNPAKPLKRAKSDSEGALPYTVAEVSDLLAAVESMSNGNRESLERAMLRARAFILCLLYTGLRLTDAVKLRRDAVADGYITVATEKTGERVKIRIPGELVTALESCPNDGVREWWFWNGTCDPVTRAHSLRRTITALGKRVGIHAHPHRFRDTFACSLLEHGADIRTVSLLLGHRSVRTTEKHYAHFVKAHQKLLDAAVNRLKW